MISHKLLANLDTWQAAGNRSVEIEKTRDSLKIWVYDYDMGEGKFITKSQDLPTTEQLRAEKKKAALATLSELEASE